MEEIKLTAENGFVIWQYKRLCIIAGCGKTDSNLKTFFNNRQHPEMEYGIIDNPLSESVGFFFPDYPVVDGSLVRYHDKRTFLFNYSLSKDRAQEIASKLTILTQLRQTGMDSKLVQSITEKVENTHVEDYALMENLSEDSDMNLEDVFATSRHTIFLHRYKGIDVEEAKERTKRLFEL